MFYTILPQSIISLIYTYDNTYHVIFKRTKKQIHTFGFKTNTLVLYILSVFIIEFIYGKSKFG